MACAEAWRGDGEVMASPFGTVPADRRPPGPAHLRARPRAHRRRGGAHGQHAVGVVTARRARARSVDAVPAGVRRGVVGPAPHHDDGVAGGPLRQPEPQLPSATGPGPRPSSSGCAGAPGNSLNHTTSYWVPAHTTRSFVEHVDMVCGVGYDRAAGGRAGGHALPRRPRGGVEPRACSTSTPPTTPCGSARCTPGVDVDDVVDGHRLRARGARPGPHHRRCPTRRRARVDPRGPRPHAAAGQGAPVLTPPSASDGAGDAGPVLPEPHPRCAPACASSSACAIPSCRRAWDGWPVPGWWRRRPTPGRSGILASATMTLDELARRDGRGAGAHRRALRGEPAHRRPRLEQRDRPARRGRGEGGELRPGAATRHGGHAARRRGRGHPHRRRPAPRREGGRVGGPRRHRPGRRRRRPHRPRAHVAAAAPGVRRRGRHGGGHRGGGLLERARPRGRARLRRGRHRHGDALSPHAGRARSPTT